MSGHRLRDGISNRLGCLTFNGLAGALIVLVGVVFAGFFKGGAMFSPGALNAKTGQAVLGGVTSHAEISQCSACHALPLSGQTMATKCLDCHTDLVQDPKNFHNVMVAQGKNTGCNGCHTDHRGAGASMTELNLSAFPHSQVGFSLQAHQKMADGSPFQCSGCHPNGYIGFEQAVCTNCHTSLDAAFTEGHAALFGQTCLACHDGKDTYGKNFSHQNVAFTLTGKHSAVICQQCHSGAKTTADLKNTPQDCNACHAKNDAHNGQFGQDCAHCHTTQGWTPASFDHAVGNFPLTGAHLKVTCNQCHVQSSSGIFKGTPTQCNDCHAKDDAHKGQFGQDCVQCHTTASWQSATFDHSKSAFPLTGAHQQVDCNKCHVPGPSGVVFKGTPTSCVSCHPDPAFHKGLFGTDCATCHNTTAYTPAKFGQAHTFPLNHGGSKTCQNCHPTNLNTYTCLTCHEPARTAARHEVTDISKIADCVRCHANGRGGD
jgi:hypothetical protein